VIGQRTLDFRTKGRGTLDVTSEVQKAVAATGVRTGVCTVFLQHTSASLVLCENADPDVRRDLETILSRLAPDGDPAYRHDTEGADDMAAHARSILTSNSFTIPGERRKADARDLARAVFIRASVRTAFAQHRCDGDGRVASPLPHRVAFCAQLLGELDLHPRAAS
jgi:secondary thiamine-phosphate synthase enzyme